MTGHEDTCQMRTPTWNLKTSLYGMNIHFHPKHRSQTHNGSNFSYFCEVCKSRNFTAFIFDVLVKFLQFDKEKITWSKAKYYAQPKFCGFFLVIFDICSYFVEGSQLWNVNDVNASKRKDEISQDREKNLSVKDCEITWVDEKIFVGPLQIF